MLTCVSDGSLGLPLAVSLLFPSVNTVCSGDVPSSDCRNRTQFVLCVFMEMITAKGNALQRKKDVILPIYIHTDAQAFECTIPSNCNVLTVVFEFISVNSLLQSVYSMLPPEFSFRC